MRNFVLLFRFRPSPLKDTATRVSLALEEWMASQPPLTSHRDVTTAKGRGNSSLRLTGVRASKFS